MAGTHRRPRRQRGAVAVVAGVTIVSLLTALGLVLDLGHIYIAKTELQNAADACALAAVWEVSPYDGTSTTRAKAMGQAVGARNSFEFQSRPIQIDAGDVTFSDTIDGTYTDDVTAATRYVRCITHYPAGTSVVMWIMHLWGTVSADVSASAIAGIQLCGFPLTFCTAHADPNPGNHFGFTVGSWYGGRAASGSATHGNYGWINYGGAGGRDLLDLIAGNGACDIAELGGEQVSLDGLTGNRGDAAARAYNTRFGVYEGSYRQPDLYRPDVTGYAYTWYSASSTGSWPPPNQTVPLPVPPELACDPNAESASCNAYYSNRSARFPAQQDANAPFNPTALNPPLTGNPRVLDAGELNTYGVRDRRLVVVPVVKCSEWPAGPTPILVRGWACGLLTAPVRDSDNVMMEYIGAARNSPCVGSGLPGNANIPRLVR